MLHKRIFPLALFCLFLTLSVCFGDITLKGETKVKPYTLVEITATTNAKGEAIVWKIETVDRKKVKYKKIGKSIVFVGPPGDYYVTATTYRLDEDKSIIPEEAEMTVTIEAGGPTPPGPGPNPPPPDPDNPDVDKELSKTLKEANDKDEDTNKVPLAKKLGEMYRTAADTTLKNTSLTTCGDLDAVIRKTSQALIGNLTITSTRDAVAAYLQKQLVVKVDTPLDDAMRNKYRAC